MLGYYATVAVATGALLVWAAGQHHTSAATNDDREAAAAPVSAQPPSGQITAHFPPAEISKFRTITKDTLEKLQAGDQAGATARIKDLETAWDNDQPTLQPLDENAWQVLDRQIDSTLKALRASRPDPATETQTLTTLLTALH
jgi:hypothetical protein